MRRAAWLAALVACISTLPGTVAARVVIGSKGFPESWILGEAAATLARRAGAEAEHRRNLGGTEIAWAALASGAIDLYPEYTGTIAEVILQTDVRTPAAMRAALAQQGIGMSAPLGFNDGYAIAVSRATASRLGLARLSDLARHPDLRVALTHEFLGRRDGWPNLSRHYGLAMRKVTGIQHELAYQAIASGAVDAIDIYTTDAQIAHLDLVALEDDRAFFPRYDAVWLYRVDLREREPAAFASISSLCGRVDEARMMRANGLVVLEQQPFEAAADSLLARSLPAAGSPVATRSGNATAIARNLGRHLELVAISLFAAVLVGVPLGILAARSPVLAAVSLSLAGLLQTVPSLALLALLIPLLGIGVWPALVALFLYSLLPIVRNTSVGLTSQPRALREAAEVVGLSGRARLLRVRLPMASPAIMAGIKTSAVINVGTATLAALIGAGGLGEPILTGIQLRRPDLILQGAVPAALLALVVQWAFDALDRLVIPRGLRAPGGGS